MPLWECRTKPYRPGESPDIINCIAKPMGVVMNMDKMVGGQFEEGLGNLKRLCEGERNNRASSKGIFSTLL
jgi:hypothetical protein